MKTKAEKMYDAFAEFVGKEFNEFHRDVVGGHWISQAGEIFRGGWEAREMQVDGGPNRIDHDYAPHLTEIKDGK